MRSSSVSASQHGPFSEAGVAKPDNRLIASFLGSASSRPENCKPDRGRHHRLTPARTGSERKGRSFIKRALSEAEFSFGKVSTMRIWPALHSRSTSLYRLRTSVGER